MEQDGELEYEKIKDKKLSEITIPAAQRNDAKNNQADEYTLSWVDIRISGKVMTTAPYNTPLTNIAEVIDMTDDSDVDLEDRDSEVGEEKKRKCNYSGRRR